MVKYLENVIAEQIFKYCTKYNIFCLHIPNESVGAAMSSSFGVKYAGWSNKLKRVGYVKGAADYIVINNEKVYFIELKTKEGRQSKEQKEFEERVKKINNANVSYHVVRSLDEFKEVLGDV